MIKLKAFTMIELIFVIVIMGIIGSFGTEFLAQAYNSFIYSKINNELQSKSNHILEYTSKKLEARIPPSVIKRKADNGAFMGATEVVADPDNYYILEWIGYDIEGFRGTTTPYWSGIVDLDPVLTTSNKLTSNFNTTEINALIGKLSYGDSSIANAAIIFNAANHNPNSFGWEGGDALNDQTMSMHPINSTTANEFISSQAGINFSGVTIYNRYMLAWTAYAIVHDTTDNHLTLYYDYQPWNGQDWETHGKSAMIMEDVSTFRIKASPDGRLFSLMVCVKSNLLGGHSICKEKTIF